MVDQAARHRAGILLAFCSSDEPTRRMILVHLAAPCFLFSFADAAAGRARSGTASHYLSRRRKVNGLEQPSSRRETPTMTDISKIWEMSCARNCEARRPLSISGRAAFCSACFAGIQHAPSKVRKQIRLVCLLGTTNSGLMASRPWVRCTMNSTRRDPNGNSARCAAVSCSVWRPEGRRRSIVLTLNMAASFGDGVRLMRPSWRSQTIRHQCMGSSINCPACNRPVKQVYPALAQWLTSNSERLMLHKRLWSNFD